jgi:hypothetical protein
MKTRLALAALLTTLACAAPASARTGGGPYPGCDTTINPGAVCAVRGWLADPANYRHGHGSPSQAIRCFYAGREAFYFKHGERKVRVRPRWSCHTMQARERFVVYQRTGIVYWLLILWADR